MPQTHIARGQLVKARKETAKLLECAHQTFDQMTLPIQPLILLPYQLSPLVGRHDREEVTPDQPVNEGLGSRGTVSNGMVTGQAVQQCLWLRDGLAPAARQRQAQRIAQPLGGQMDFAATAAPTTPQRLVRLTAAHRCAHNRAVQQPIFPIGVVNQGAQHRCPHPRLTPARRAFGATMPVPVLGGLLRALAVEEAVMIIDATGFGLSWISHHYLSQGRRWMRDWLKGVFLVGLDSQYILAWSWARGQGGSDAQYLNRLRRRGHCYGVKAGRRREWTLMGDKGFDGIQARATNLIRLRQGQHPVVRPNRRLRLELTGQTRLDGLYGRRILIQTVFSALKRKSGDTLPISGARLPSKHWPTTCIADVSPLLNPLSFEPCNTAAYPG